MFAMCGFTDVSRTCGDFRVVPRATESTRDIIAVLRSGAERVRPIAERLNPAAMTQLGQLDFRLGSDQRELLGPGDVYYAPKGFPHGDSHFIGDPTHGEVWILDVFQPVREEYRGG